ncbi:MAG: DsbC family protein [Gammaproteobacteria bacterium]|nr:DsbC family protein [Gammaproteobacteria bacterium]MCW8909183.1 DsbC family protein [Gammaproteobacteria bacterium]MCW9004385.1 DsbC family protein [Gammaproteobacteria bacterium]MCW9056682.1 DsbC family protein [Gammaproteobacteria bacterium]
MKFLLKLSMFVLIMGLHPVMAGDANEADIKQLKAALAKIVPQSTDAVITATPIDGLYQVLVTGQVVYMTKDAKYLIDGDLMDMQSKVNLTESARGSIRKDALSQLGEENMLVYKPKGEVKQTITVFTDIYCPYCRKLHNEMAEYMDNNVKVRYIFLPFKGKKSYDDSVSVWCAKDRNAALDEAKAGEDIEQKTCDNPIDKHKALATTLSIRGTPAIMFEDGQLTPGYIPASKLIAKLKAEGKL